MAQCKKCIQNAEGYMLALKMKSPFKTRIALTSIPECTMHQGSSPGLHILIDICTPTLQGDAWSASHPRVIGRPRKLESKAGRKERLTGALMIPKLSLPLTRADAVASILVLMMLGFPKMATGVCSPQGGRGRILRVGHPAGNAREDEGEGPCGTGERGPGWPLSWSCLLGSGLVPCQSCRQRLFVILWSLRHLGLVATNSDLLKGIKVVVRGAAPPAEFPSRGGAPCSGLRLLEPVLSYLPHFMLTSAEVQQAINAL